MENLEKNTNGEQVTPAKNDLNRFLGPDNEFHTPIKYSPGKANSVPKKNTDASTSAATSAIQQGQMKKAERGWNNHYVRSGTYNFALSKLQV